MYALTRCGVCRRPRIADLSSKESACPYCGCVQKTQDLPRYFQSSDQNAVREALSQATGFVPPDEVRKRERVAAADPYSTLVYRYEHCSDLDEKMQILAEGLKNGEFKNTSTAEELMDIYAMYERAVLYDWALFKGKYSLSEYSDRLLPHVLDTFVDGI